MLHKIDLGSEKAVGFSWEGKFDQKAFKQSVDQFLPELRSRAHMNVYMEVHEISEIEARAIWDELKFDIQNFSELKNKIDKIALATDVKWLRSLTDTSMKFVPGVKIRTFSLEEREVAKIWAIE